MARMISNDLSTGPEQDESGTYLQWGVAQSTILAAQLVSTAGIDLLDVSSGGNWAEQKIPVGPSYQAPLSEYIKKNLPQEASGLVVTGVGLITHAKQAEELIQEGKCDVVWLAREFLRHADFVLDVSVLYCLLYVVIADTVVSGYLIGCNGVQHRRSSCRSVRTCLDQNVQGLEYRWNHSGSSKNSCKAHLYTSRCESQYTNHL